MDLGFFVGGLVIGFGSGLICKKNKIQVLPQTFDIGVFSQKHSKKMQHQSIMEKQRDEKYQVYNGTRHKKF